jgi:hypothetical protein
VLLIVATDVVAEAHVTEFVMFCVELSLNVPVAVNCWVLPFAIDGFAGVTAIDTSVGDVEGVITVESEALAATEPPPTMFTTFTCGDVAFAATFTVTVIGG